MVGKNELRWAAVGDADHGYFGPGSLSWKVLTAPAVPVMIAQITHILEAPHVDFQSILLDHDPMYPTNGKRQRGRSRDSRGKGGRISDRISRTVRGPLPIIFGDRATADATARRLWSYHRPMTGRNPDDGTEYSAVDPNAMLFASVTIAHGALIAYERFACDGLRPPRRLSAADRDRFFAETAELAVLMGVPREQVPVTAAAVNAYYRSLDDKYRSRRGWLRVQLRTALTQLRRSPDDRLSSVAVDVLTVASTLLAYTAAPRPSRRLHHLPAAADPVLALVHALSLPLFAALQIRFVREPVLDALIGRANREGIERAARLDPVNAVRNWDEPPAVSRRSASSPADRWP